MSNPVKVTELLADYSIENPRKVLTPMDPSCVITMKPMVEGISGRVRQTTGRGKYV